MGLIDFLKGLFGLRSDGVEDNPYGARPEGASPSRKEKAAEAPAGVTGAKPGRGLGLDQLAVRLGLSVERIRAVPVAYRRHTVPKRTGGTRTILAPEPELRLVQKAILRRVLGRLKSHPAATGFERGHSIVTNALPHARAGVLIRMDVKDFFGTTAARRVEDYFRVIGWGAEAAKLLTKLTTSDGGLPQGAPTSPRLSNLVNYAIDARLAAAAGKFGAAYSRYADDITFSFTTPAGPARTGPKPATGEPAFIPRTSAQREHEATSTLIRITKAVLGEYGYRIHTKRKLHIRRRHQSQRVTGLVVNDRVALPREVRRRLRAVRHHLAAGREATLTPAQLTGWNALEHMVQSQRGPN